MAEHPPVDHFAEMLRRNKAPAIEFLLGLCPDEPVTSVAPSDFFGWTPTDKRRFRAETYAIRKKYPGYQPLHSKCEAMKYADMPEEGDPLYEFVRARISHAKALWSRDVGAKWTKHQFPDWLRDHIDGETWIAPLWPFEPGYFEALQLLRLAFGMSPIPPFWVRQKWA